MTLRNAFAETSTAARQDAAKTTLDAILVKLIATPATAAGQTAVVDKLEAVRLLLTSEGGYLDGVEGLLGAIGTLLSGTLAISAGALPLPAGAATGVRQDAGNTTLASILTALGTTLAVSAAALPLPVGAATDAKLELMRLLLSAQGNILAGTVGLSASGKAAVTQALTGTGASDPFTPIPGRPFNITVSGGSGVVGDIERRFNGGAWFKKFPDVMRQSLPETFTDTESEAGVDVRFNLTAIGSGAVTVRFSQ